ncbi:hypothetical protein EDC01DRAFT_422715 [Geopyxis carbonaria]|nr:hypothetical protein EDC01DRAFT_422715 [Geopyxis carbonaria]
MSKVRYLSSCRQLLVPARTPGGRHLSPTRCGNPQLGTTSPTARSPVSPYQQFRGYGGPAAGGANDYTFGPSNDVQPQPTTQHVGGAPEKGKNKEEKDDREGIKSRKGDGKTGGDDDAHRHSGTAWKMFESAATTAASLSILGLAGYAYHKYYKHLVLHKIDGAFNEGDPALSLASASRDDPKEPWILLDEQEKIDRIVAGEEQGHYYLLIGEKGTGKTSMLLSAMHKTMGEACSMMEAHADPEIFRIRLGKALDFEFHEDYIGSLFSIRGPRETTALLDIERALNKLEKVALKRRRKTGKPLVMIINGMHMVRDDELGKDLVELLQQRAEGWAAAGLVTMVFNSDDYWVYERMKQYGSRMELISVRDLSKQSALKALRNLRGKYYKEDMNDENITKTLQIFEKVYELVGGRLAFLNKVSKSRDMLDKCEEINEIERTWLLNKCWILGEGMDDDVMDQQKFASSAMLLVKELVDMEQASKEEDDAIEGHKLPELPLHKAREVMTRADFIQQYDHDNIFTIDSRARVRADSVPMMNAFRSVAAEPGFAQFLDETMERIGDIESLGRTRELTLKDLWNGGKYTYDVKNGKGQVEKSMIFDVKRGTKGIHGDETEGESAGEKED